MNEIENTSTNNSDNIRNERIDATDYVNKLWNNNYMTSYLFLVNLLKTDFHGFAENVMQN